MAKNATKRALISSALALLVCVSMLIGTTYAWFTDSVVSNNNIITAGNLDLEVEYTLDGENWDTLDGADDLFQKGLWEPGHTEVVALKVTNAGTLAFKYTANMNIVNEVIGTSVEGNDIVLSDILTVSTVTQQVNQIGDILLNMVFNGAENTDKGSAKSFKSANVLQETTELLAGDSHYIIITVDMAETVGNEANYRGDKIPSIEFGINVFATQYTYENDTFGNDYDLNAPWTGEVDTAWYNTTDTEFVLESAEEFAGFAALVNNGTEYFEGKTIKLGRNIDLNNLEWTPIGSATLDHGFMGNFDGNGKTISNLTINNIALDADGYAYAGLFGVTEGAAGAENEIKNLTIKNVTINTTGAIVAAAIAYPYYTTLSNITVCGDIAITGGDYTSGVLAYTRRCTTASNITINGNAGSYITGKQVVGGVISDIQMNGGLKANYSNFSASNLTITGDKMVGGISGIICNQTLNGANVNNVTLVCSDNRVGIVSGSFDTNPVINNVKHSNVTGATSIVGAPYGTTGGNITIDGKECIGDVVSLQAAINEAKDGDVITLGASISGNVTVAQKPGVVVTIDGNGSEFKGGLLVDGGSNASADEGIIIQNVVFTGTLPSGVDACIRLGEQGNNNTRYTSNVTIKDCIFDIEGAVGIKSYTGGDKNLTIINCVATEKAHSLLQAKGIDGIEVVGCEVYSKNGLNFNNSTNVIVDDCNVDVKGYAVRFGEGSVADTNAETYLIKDCTLKSACAESDDAVIVLRGTAANATLTITNTTLVGTNEIANNTNATVK